jgi:hypothetical protein
MNNENGQILAYSAIGVGILQMIYSVYTVKQMKIDPTTFPLIYSSILASVLWLLHQYRIDDFYSVGYSIVSLCVQLFILYELKSMERSREKQI